MFIQMYTSLLYPAVFVFFEGGEQNRWKFYIRPFVRESLILWGLSYLFAGFQVLYVTLIFSSRYYQLASGIAVVCADFDIISIVFQFS